MRSTRFPRAGTAIRRPTTPQGNLTQRRHQLRDRLHALPALHVERAGRAVPQDGAEQPLQRDQFQPVDHSTRSTRQRSAARSTGSSARRTAARRPSQTFTGNAALAARAVRLPRQHGRRPGHPIERQQLPDASTRPIRYCFIYDNGVTYQNSTVNMADITDGTSHRHLRREPDPDRRLVAGDKLLRPNQHRSDDQQADSLQRPELLHLLDEQAPQHGQFRFLRRQRPAR